MKRVTGYHLVATMKLTEYFLRNLDRPDRRSIEMDWIERVVERPVREVVQVDGRIRRWAPIEEAEGRFLRVVLLEEGETGHNAFFDRRFRETDDES